MQRLERAMTILENRYGYIPDVVSPDDYIFGDGQLGDTPIQPDGQWDAYLPADELQNRGYDTYSCTSEGTLHCTEILEKKEFGYSPTYSVRFLSTVSGTGPQRGNSCHVVAETLRKGGCVTETDCPFDAFSYTAFYTPPSEAIKRLARIEFADNSFGHSWLPDTKLETMMSALTYSPLGASVYAWGIPDIDGIYHRPPGAEDCHWVTIYGYVEGQYWKVFDSYNQIHKKLAWDYGFGQAKRYTLRRVISTPPSPSNGWWAHFVAAVRKVFGL